MVPLFVFASSEQPDSPLGGIEGPHVVSWLQSKKK